MNRENLLHKWLNNESLTQAEQQALREDSSLKELVRIAEFSQNLNTPEFDQSAVFATINTLNKPAKVRKLAPLTIMLRMAAVLAVVFASYVYISSLDTAVNTQIAQKTELVLPDNSQVVLNGESELSYNKSSWKDARELELSGEAYFNVAKGSTFTVHTDLGDVTVVGTQFNVLARGTTFSVSCFEGVVSVSLNDKVVTLTQGMALQLDAGTYTSQEGLLVTQPVWINNESQFKNAPLAQVLKSLEAQYGIKIDASKVNLETKFTGSFTHSDLEIALQSICNPLQMTYNVLNSEHVVLHEAN